MPKAYTYCRFSSGSQSKGSSIERQIQIAAEWQEKHPEYELSDLRFVDEAKSGYSGENLRYELGNILEAIEKRQIRPGDAILVEALDRIGRQDAFTMLGGTLKKIIDANVAIFTAEDDQEYSKITLQQNSSLLWLLVGKVQQSHEYSQRLSRRVRAGYKRMRDKAKAGESFSRQTPFWLTKEGKAIPDRVEAVKACIDLYLKGYGTRKILQTLEPKYPELQAVHPTTLVRWFRNRALAGDWAIYKEDDENISPQSAPSEVIKDVYPAIVSRETFYDIGVQLKNRAKQMAKATSYELSGLCVCGECGGAFYYRRKAYKDRTIIYANCSTYLKRGTSHCTNNKTWPYEVLLHIHDTTNDYHLQLASEIENRNVASKEQVVKEQELEEVKKNKENITKVFQRFPDDAELVARYTNLKEKEKELKTAIQVLANENTSPVLSSFFEDASEDPVMLNAILKDIGYRIKLLGSKAIVDAGGALSKYTLIRRSQIYRCYILHHESSPEAIEELGHVDAEDWDHEERYLAINHKGLFSEAESDQELINLLKARKSQNIIV
ncbi:recombinase family protein [Idiomarina abyssalis]|uniref:recombinase family protein n=1 Tax=Idiomarina abyssalis TaxID=86102 RepID=UPI003A8DA4D4